MLVVYTLVLRWDCQTARVVDAQEMTFKFSKIWERLIVEFCSANVSVKSLVGGGVEMMITSATNGSFDEFNV